MGLCLFYAICLFFIHFYFTPLLMGTLVLILDLKISEALQYLRSTSVRAGTYRACQLVPLSTLHLQLHAILLYCLFVLKQVSNAHYHCVASVLL